MWSNNDLMDPNWKPDFGPDVTPLGKLQRLINAFWVMHEQVLKVPEDDLKLDPNQYQINFKLRIETVKEMRKAIIEYRGETNPPNKPSEE